MSGLIRYTALAAFPSPIQLAEVRTDTPEPK